MNEYAKDGETVVRDLKGFTSWTALGVGEYKRITYSLSVTIEEYKSDLYMPSGIGFFYAFP